MPFSNKRSLAECVIGLLADAPGPGQFSDERVLGPTRADIIIGLCARRVFPIEYNSSNRVVNSFKRVNHEALGKATKWLRRSGRMRSCRQLSSLACSALAI